MSINKAINSIDNDRLTDDLNRTGYAIIPNILTEKECDILVSEYNHSELYRKTVVMERHQYGLGEYKYFTYPLPDVVQQLRTGIYPLLAPVANNWMKVLNIDKEFPAAHKELVDYCHAEGQLKPTPLILQYGRSGYNALHQDLYGDVFFPMQAVIILSEPGKDFEGGEFVLVEQRPRAQSRAIVLKPNKGDLLVFTTNFRPVRGSRGYHKVNMRHGVSEITDGRRYTLGVIFHDAK
ncbi:prolyl 4-hydroxylase subunit alpha [Mucilaginibacter hurinus]|uniref:Prolyl 4-hydroxylase subunit alpha n=1 Tax=Mucilaginibacter hurinus TaxID=2201324 RepID=A0A367GT79_9SPHI|nr:2OG-Fe(II) oxygenase [Mucilaginibacter hurinus]RCH56634.1 prolyl 4-hydroxylase subunit alpha [Mucilaginibacter hurinus]